jgi:hypothetical protein
VVTQVLCNISPPGVLWDKICIQARAWFLCNCALYHAFLLPGIVSGTSWKCATESHWPVMDYIQKQLESWVYAGQVILECSVSLLPMLYRDLEVQDLYAICTLCSRPKFDLESGVEVGSLCESAVGRIVQQVCVNQKSQSHEEPLELWS